MPMLKVNHVGLINWAFVAEKINTIFEWDESKPNPKEPEL